MIIFTDEEIDNMSQEDAVLAIEKAVYKATDLFERLEFRKKVWGNGHHIRQNAATQIGEMMKTRWRKKEEFVEN